MTDKKQQLVVSVALMLRYRSRVLTAPVTGVYNTHCDKFSAVRQNAITALNRLYA